MGTKHSFGFTLIELLVVIAVIGILTAIGLASYTTAQKQSRDARRLSDMKEIQNAWEQYYADNNSSYPGPASPALPVACTLSLLPTPGTYFPGGFPIDPKTGTAYPQVQNWSSCTSASYCFCAGMETSVKSVNSGVDCANSPEAKYPLGFYCVHNLQ